MLGPGDSLPDARVWDAPRAEPRPLGDALAGDGLVLLCFYTFDWSTT